MTDHATEASSLKEVADRMIAATRKFVADAIAPLSTRLATVETMGTRVSAMETRCAALAMILAKQQSPDKELPEFDDLFARIKLLEARVATLQNMPALRYSGVWSAGRQYDVGEVVTDHGSMWHANRPTRERPGSGGDD